MINENYDTVARKFDDLRNQFVGVKEILDIISINFNNPKVLDLGCGTGFPIGKQVSKISSKYLGIDNSNEMLNVFQRNVPNADSILMEMVDIDRVDDKFDLIFAWGAVCHLITTDQKILFKKIYARLNDNGIFAFTGGEIKGQCSGSVGELSIIHHSLGKVKYQMLGNIFGLRVTFIYINSENLPNKMMHRSRLRRSGDL
jgi:predicted TPR repeat methyltransferase